MIIPKLSKNTTEVAGKAFWNIVKNYDLKRDEQAVLLGHSSGNRKTLNNWEATNSIPMEVDKINRVSMLIGIHKNLRIMFPYNKFMAYNWIKTKLADFGGKTPLEFILENPLKSYERLFTVRRYLDIKRTML
jgi:hypothetical protein